MRSTTSLAALLLCTLIVPMPAAGDATSPALMTKAAGLLSLHGKTVPQIALRLAGISGAPFAIESLDRSALFTGKPGASAKLIDLDTTEKTTVAEALDAAVAQDSGYEWRFESGWLVVRAKGWGAASWLDTPFAGVVPQSGLLCSQVSEAMSGYKPHDWTIQYIVQYRFEAGRESLAPLSTARTVRDVLNSILWLGGAKGWVAFPARDAEGNILKYVLEVLV